MDSERAERTAMEDYEQEVLEFEDYIEARGAWAYIFWTLVFVLGLAIVRTGSSILLSTFEVLFALFLFRFFSWFGMEYYRCN
jgi:hypothetical protein